MTGSLRKVWVVLVSAGNVLQFKSSCQQKVKLSDLCPHKDLLFAARHKASHSGSHARGSPTHSPAPSGCESDSHSHSGANGTHCLGAISLGS
jgi:hypothetical protein